MVYLPFIALITIPAKEMSQFRIHQGREVLPYCILNVCSDHLKKIIGLVMDFVEKVDHFCYKNRLMNRLNSKRLF
jgi:hypothetical protein